MLGFNRNETSEWTISRFPKVSFIKRVWVWNTFVLEISSTFSMNKNWYSQSLCTQAHFEIEAAMNLKMAHSKSILQELQTHKMRQLNCKSSVNIKTSRVFHFSRCSRQQINKVMQWNSCLRCSNGSRIPRFTSSFDSKGKLWKRNFPHCKRVVESLLVFSPIKSPHQLGTKQRKLQVAWK